MRRRILLGLLPLVILLVVTGSYAVALFSRLGGAIDIILQENYRSVVAAQNMKEAAERMDSGLAFTLAGEEERGRKLYRENEPLLLEHLRVEEGNITVAGEAERVRDLREAELRYQAKGAAFLASHDLAERRQIYFSELLPLFTRIKDSAQEILNLNQANMVQADQKARRLATESARCMILAILFGVGVAVLLAVRLQRAILRPIRDVTEGARELGDGNYDQVVPVPTRDELGELADAFNKMAGRLRAYRQVTDEKLVRARQATESTFSALPDPVLVLGSEGGIEFQNPAAVRLLQGLQPRALPSAVQSAAEQVLKGGADLLPESLADVVCVRVEDRETFLLPRIVGLRDEAGSVSAAAIILQDVTRFRLLDDVKTNLVSTVSHELKTPLTSVRMGLHLLLEEKIGILNPQQTELLMVAREDSERLLRMINDLLDLARLESGAGSFALQSVAASELVRSALADAEVQAGQRGVRVAAQIRPDLPPVLVDPQRLAHVFANYVSNAVKHAPPGSEILLQAGGESDGSVRFSVIDHGPGIPREYQTRIFDRFFRIPGSDKTGAGLGLAIAREIVVAHGGHIGVESTPGGGSAFYFVLPMAVRHSEITNVSTGEAVAKS